MKTQIIACLTLISAALASSIPANAQCSSMTPRLAALLPNAAVAKVPLTPRVLTANSIGRAATPAITGLWMTTFTSGGNVVDQAFEVFHSDGTEMMVDTAAPSSGNVCVGVWAQTGVLTLALNHPSWTFDDKGNLNGTATIRMNVMMDPNGRKFAGSFDVEVLDLNGNKVFAISGTVAATRIDVD